MFKFGGKQLVYLGAGVVVLPLMVLGALAILTPFGFDTRLKETFQVFGPISLLGLIYLLLAVWTLYLERRKTAKLPRAKL